MENKPPRQAGGMPGVLGKRRGPMQDNYTTPEEAHKKGSKGPTKVPAQDGGGRQLRSAPAAAIQSQSSAAAKRPQAAAHAVSNSDAQNSRQLRARRGLQNPEQRQGLEKQGDEAAQHADHVQALQGEVWLLRGQLDAERKLLAARTSDLEAMRRDLQSTLSQLEQVTASKESLEEQLTKQGREAASLRAEAAERACENLELHEVQGSNLNEQQVAVVLDAMRSFLDRPYDLIPVEELQLVLQGWGCQVSEPALIQFLKHCHDSFDNPKLIGTLPLIMYLEEDGKRGFAFI
ncbi:hypothetical protein DUNSADRAFT_17337 [Dunaliella salina]|uniref:Uncharacterized protein n=1 Tax=Dunaliella salina TaxID=3046 RepID=A0ABQ7H043_DUNSA|nr:hypothetical protein DUNSADRAFT_17337 [Dunaliella salina]|eukprot:KAF5840234.1 hypothetical protein DUNSADRAFT_17337 [Dunaliella salina]